MMIMDNRDRELFWEVILPTHKEIKATLGRMPILEAEITSACPNPESIATRERLIQQFRNEVDALDELFQEQAELIRGFRPAFPEVNIVETDQ